MTPCLVTVTAMTVKATANVEKRVVKKRGRKLKNLRGGKKALGCCKKRQSKSAKLKGAKVKKRECKKSVVAATVAVAVAAIVAAR